MHCTQPTAWIYGAPEDPDVISKNDSQLIYGEEFIIERTDKVHAYGASALDGYQGYVRLDDLGASQKEYTHYIDVPMTHTYVRPSLKTRPTGVLPMTAQIAMTDTIENGFQKSEAGLWIFQNHLKPLESVSTDQIETIIQFLNAPYLYGGQSIYGIDCSGLIRIAMLRAGINCPRDCDRQIKSISGDISNTSTLQSGDIVYLAGHVVMMLDSYSCINATERHMKTLVEPFLDIIEVYKEIISIKRFT